MILEGWKEVESAATGLKWLNTSQRWDKWVIGPAFILKASPPCLWAEQGLYNLKATCVAPPYWEHMCGEKDAKEGRESDGVKNRFLGSELVCLPMTAGHRKNEGDVGGQGASEDLSS